MTGILVISIIIPTLNAEASLAAALTALVTGVVEGVVREVIIVDGGSTDHTLSIADAAGAVIVRNGPSRGEQLAAGADIAKSNWLLFLHADTVLEAGWEREAATFIERVDVGQRPEAAAAFRFALDDLGFKPRLLEALVALRSSVLRLPYGDQGLLIRKRLYGRIGGYRPLPLMEDVDIVRRLRRPQMIIMRTRAVTSAIRYRRDGYIARSARNLACLALYYMKVPAQLIARIYG